MVTKVKLAEAEQIFVRALAGYEKALGPDHISIPSTVHNLGNLYHLQGKLVEAEQMFVRALAGYEKALGPDHTSTLGRRGRENEEAARTQSPQGLRARRNVGVRED
jgi:tetratricopeptide (TPR) repeat protein